MQSKTARYQKAANDPAVCQELLRRIEEVLAGRRLKFMEVCGTHTTSLFQSGVRSLLPVNIRHVSGPGCPVCVTHESEVALFMELARRKDAILATYGDLARIPGTDGSSLKNIQAAGGKIRIVYSPLDALKLAWENPDDEVIFLSVGFETTAPGAAAAILKARRDNTSNFSILSMHKLTPPVLESLAMEEDLGLDAFLLPGHVATVTGSAPFSFLANEYGFPAVVGGFEAADLLLAILEIARQLAENRAEIFNAYPRAVHDCGNPAALGVMNQVFEKCAGLWRGLGELPESGLKIKEEYAGFDAMRKFSLSLPEVSQPSACQCGNILKGRLAPDQCPLFGKRCTPANPVGPCMVSTEGSCAAYYRYGG